MAFSDWVVTNLEDYRGFVENYRSFVDASDTSNNYREVSVKIQQLTKTPSWKSLSETASAYRTVADILDQLDAVIKKIQAAEIELEKVISYSEEHAIVFLLHIPVFKMFYKQNWDMYHSVTGIADTSAEILHSVIRGKSAWEVKAVFERLEEVAESLEVLAAVSTETHVSQKAILSTWESHLPK